jgi:hypothetical protein
MWCVLVRLDKLAAPLLISNVLCFAGPLSFALRGRAVNDDDTAKCGTDICTAARCEQSAVAACINVPAADLANHATVAVSHSKFNRAGKTFLS